MPDDLVTLAQIQAARPLVASRVHRTPLLTSQTAARFVEAATGIAVADGLIYLKAENLQKTGSFKPRGMSWKVESLTADERARGIITLSAGNAAQAYAWAGRTAGVPVTVVMPAGAVRSKVDACLGYGAEVILHGVDVGSGAIRWQVSLGAPSDGGLIAAGSIVAAARADARLIGIDAAGGKAVWTTRLQSAASTALTIDDTFIVAIAGGTSIEGIDARKGRHRWRVTVKTAVPLPATIAAESVWLSGGGRTGALVRLDRATGALQGMADSGTAVAGMATDGTYVFATGGGPSRLRVFDDRGIVRVELALPNVCPEPAIGEDRGYLADPTGRVITIDRTSGHPSDVATVPFEPIGAPVLVGDRLVMLARDGRIWAVAAAR